MDDIELGGIVYIAVQSTGLFLAAWIQVLAPLLSSRVTGSFSFSKPEFIFLSIKCLL